MSGMDDFCSQCVERPEEGPCPLHPPSAWLTDTEKDRLLNADSRSHMFERVEHIIGGRLAAERERWVEHLSPLCDDEWLRRRDRAMELPGAKGHRWERRASSAWEQAANAVRHVLNELADYEDQFGNRHAAYMKWLRAGRDEGEAQR